MSRPHCWFFVIVMPALVATAGAIEPIAHWTFDADASDHVGTNDGVLVGDAFIDTMDARVGGGALHLDGDGDYVDLPEVLTIGNCSHTVTAWLKAPQPGQDGLEPGERVGVVLGNYSLFPNTNWEIHAAGEPRIWWNNGQINVQGHQDLRDQVWHHVAWVRDKAANRYFMYVDGVLDEQAMLAGSDIVFNAAHRIGGDRRGTSPWFHGLIDDLRIYDQALTPEQLFYQWAAAPLVLQRGIGAGDHPLGNTIDAEQSGPSFPFDWWARAWAGVDTSEDDETLRSLLQFDLGGLPDDIVINQATLRLYVTSVHDLLEGNAWVDVSVHRVRPGRPWNPFEVTWQQYDLGLNWTHPGADDPCDDICPSPDDMVRFDSQDYAHYDDDGDPCWYEWDVTAGVQAWLAGAENHGWLVRAETYQLDGTDPTHVGIVFASMNYGDNYGTPDPALTVFRPQLVIDWSEPDLVDLPDFAACARHWFADTCGEPSYCDGADVDRNGVVDLLDLQAIVAHWLQQRPASWP